jgi:hypothetical protein
MSPIHSVCFHLNFRYRCRAVSPLLGPFRIKLMVIYWLVQVREQGLQLGVGLRQRVWGPGGSTATAAAATAAVVTASALWGRYLPQQVQPAGQWHAVAQQSPAGRQPLSRVIVLLTRTLYISSDYSFRNTFQSNQNNEREKMINLCASLTRECFVD